MKEHWCLVLVLVTQLLHYTLTFFLLSANKWAAKILAQARQASNVSQWITEQCKASIIIQDTPQARYVVFLMNLREETLKQ